MTEPDHSPHGDELLQRYREASADDTRRPGAHVRDAVRAHAQMVIDAGKQAGSLQAAAAEAAQRPAANQSRWKISALAGFALAGLTGLLVLQFDRGTDEEKEMAFGQPSATTPSSPSAPSRPASPPPAASPAAAPTPSAIVTPAPVAPSRPAAQTDARKQSAETAKPALKSPAHPAQDKAMASLPANEPAVQKKEAEAPPPLAAAAPPAARPPIPAPAAAPGVAPIQENAQPSQAPRMAGAATGSLSASPAQADMAAAAPAARPAPAPAPAPAATVAAAAPAAPAARALAPLQKQENARQYQAPRAEANAGPNRLAGALQDAARAGRLELLDRLLQQGAPVNAADPAGRTPLVLAVMQGHTAVVQRLLAAGANPALVDQEGLNALQHARRLGFDGIAHLIEAAS